MPPSSRESAEPAIGVSDSHVRRASFPRAGSPRGRLPAPLSPDPRSGRTGHVGHDEPEPPDPSRRTGAPPRGGGFGDGRAGAATPRRASRAALLRRSGQARDGVARAVPPSRRARRLARERGGAPVPLREDDQREGPGQGLSPSGQEHGGLPGRGERLRAGIAGRGPRGNPAGHRHGREAHPLLDLRRPGPLPLRHGQDVRGHASPGGESASSGSSSSSPGAASWVSSWGRG